VRCFDARLRTSCLTTQSVALVGRYAEVHGSYLANDFPGAGGIVVGAAWGGDVGTPFFRLARDRVRLAGRLTLDVAMLYHGTLDFSTLTFAAGPQLWVRLTRSTFFLARVAAGGSVVLFNVVPVGFRGYSFAPDVDAAIGLAFDLQ
jgi:hypothetical protein